MVCNFRNGNVLRVDRSRPGSLLSTGDAHHAALAVVRPLIRSSRSEIRAPTNELMDVVGARENLGYETTSCDTLTIVSRICHTAPFRNDAPSIRAISSVWVIQSKSGLEFNQAATDPDFQALSTLIFSYSATFRSAKWSVWSSASATAAYKRSHHSRTDCQAQILLHL